MAPVSVLRTWEFQVKEHCTDNLLKVYTYHDKSRDITAAQLQKYDIVITSYNIVAGEFQIHSGAKAEPGPTQKKRKGNNTLFNVKWKVQYSHFLDVANNVLISRNFPSGSSSMKASGEFGYNSSIIDLKACLQATQSAIRR